MVDRRVTASLIVDVKAQTKFCPQCQVHVPFADWRPSDLEDRPTSRGWCRTCNNAYEKAWRDSRDLAVQETDRKVRSERERLRGQKVRAEDPKAYGDKMRLWNYALTPERYDAMVIDQLGICANPRCDEPLSHVDHDHACCPTDRSKQKTCGECVRGLLCRECNLFIGIAGDSIERLLGAVEYLQQRKG